MNFTFADALRDLGEDFAFRIANELRPQNSYVLSRILPPRNRPTYSISSAAMEVTPTMAGLAGMDSAYAPGGQVSISEFLEKSAKVANEVPLSEEALRELQMMLREAQLSGGATKEQVVETVLNFTEKVVVQAHIDTFEYLRGQALAFGQINWTFNDKNLNVDYGIPDGNIFNTRTTASGEAYGAASSAFWADHRSAVKRLGYNYNGPYMHPDTFDEIVLNEANKIEVSNQNGNVFTLRRYIGDGNNLRLSGDQRDQVAVTLYGAEGEVIDPADPDSTINVPFLPRGRVIYTGTGNTNAFRVGEGSTTDPLTGEEIGYTHIAPTVEGGGASGRWAQTYTPEHRPWQLIGRGVTNGLPVVTTPDKLCVASTEMA